MSDLPMRPDHPVDSGHQATEHYQGAQHGLVDYFTAGAKDWGSDVRDAVQGNLHGPSMTHRQKFIDEDAGR